MHHEPLLFVEQRQLVLQVGVASSVGVVVVAALVFAVAVVVLA
jgi:hypothetical protein